MMMVVDELLKCCLKVYYQWTHNSQSVLNWSEVYRLNYVYCYIKVCYYEILAGMWLRNGHQIRGQAMTYIQSHFCKSTIDIDVYLLQVIIYFFAFSDLLGILAYHKFCLAFRRYRSDGWMHYRWSFCIGACSLSLSLLCLIPFQFTSLRLSMMSAVSIFGIPTQVVWCQTCLCIIIY